MRSVRADHTTPGPQNCRASPTVSASHRSALIYCFVNRTAYCVSPHTSHPATCHLYYIGHDVDGPPAQLAVSLHNMVDVRP